MTTHRFSKKPAEDETPPGPVELMRRATQMHRRLFVAAAEKGCCTPATMLVLRAIDDHPMMNQLGLSAKTGIDKSTMADLLRRLHRIGLVSILPGNDARVRLAALTPEGRKVLRRAEKAYDEAEHNLMLAVPAGHHAIVLKALAAMANAANIVQARKVSANAR